MKFKIGDSVNLIASRIRVELKNFDDYNRCPPHSDLMDINCKHAWATLLAMSKGVKTRGRIIGLGSDCFTVEFKNEYGKHVANYKAKSLRKVK